MEALVELVKEGKIRNIGISECSASTLRRAHKIHPIAAVQMEYSLFALEIEREEFEIKKTCNELGVSIVAYSPLGRGILSGKFKSRSDIPEGDLRLHFPRFSEENFSLNLELVDKVKAMAEKKKCTASQLSLAWLLKQGDNIIPIPGTYQQKNLSDNIGSCFVELSDEEVKELREFADKAEIKGERYPGYFMLSLFGDTI